jgi:hypothetical protein
MRTEGPWFVKARRHLAFTRDDGRTLSFAGLELLIAFEANESMHWSLIGVRVFSTHQQRFALAGLFLAVAGGLKVWADGIPGPQPLTYAGMLQEGSGVPITTTRQLQISLWNDATATASTNQKCSTSQSVTPDNQGRFRVVLEPACLDAVKAFPNLWVQLTVQGVDLQRTKFGAVPYAVEASRCENTSQIITGNVTVNVSVGGQYPTISAALRSLEDKVIRGRVTIQVADGAYVEPASIVLDHPDGARIRIRGNAANATSVVLSFSSDFGVQVGPAAALGGLEGMTLRRAASPGQPFIGIKVFNTSFADLGPNLRIEGFNYGTQVESSSSINVKGLTVVGVGSGTYGVGVGISQSSSAYITQSAVSQVTSGYYSSAGSSLVVDSSSVQNAVDGWRSNDGAYTSAGGGLSFSAVTTTFFAAGAGVMRVPTPLPAGATVFPSPLGNVGGQNSYIFQ